MGKRQMNYLPDVDLAVLDFFLILLKMLRNNVVFSRLNSFLESSKVILEQISRQYVMLRMVSRSKKEKRRDNC